MTFSTVRALRGDVKAILTDQGYAVNDDGSFRLRSSSRTGRRFAHQIAKRERIAARADFIRSYAESVKPLMVGGSDIDVAKIRPQLIEVQPDSPEEELFRWWNLVWWSLPYEHAYGRQMRFLVWDQYHKAVIGLIGLQSPILRWSVRDDFLGISTESRDYWVNQSLSAQRLGAVPPYNQILGGKLVSLLMTSDSVSRKFSEKYSGRQTLMKERILPARLLFITTTGAYGKSSVYQRLSFGQEKVALFLGYSQGSGSFHIPNALFNDLVQYLDSRDYDVARGFGSGPSTKLRLIDQALGLLGYRNGAEHGIKRAVYLFPLVKNLRDVILFGERPLRCHRRVHDLTDYWKMRWAIPRLERDPSFAEFSVDKFLANVRRNVTLSVKSCSIE